MTVPTDSALGLLESVRMIGREWLRASASEYVHPAAGRNTMQHTSQKKNTIPENWLSFQNYSRRQEYHARIYDDKTQVPQDDIIGRSKIAHLIGLLWTLGACLKLKKRTISL